MGLNDYGRSDRFAYAYYVPSQADFEYIDPLVPGLGNIIVQIPSGWYYPFLLTGGVWQGAAAIYSSIESQLNAALALSPSPNRIDFEFATPPLATNSALIGGGIRVFRKAGAQNFTFRATNAVGEAVLGQGIGQIFDQANGISRNLIPGLWSPPSKTCDRRSYARREAFRSEAGRVAYSNRWNAMQVRQFDYKALPASHVRSNPYPSTQAAMPAVWDGRPGIEGSVEPELTNSFEEMWQNVVQGGYPISAYYDVALIPSIDPNSWPAENLRPIEGSWEKFSDLASDFGPDELYRVRFKGEIIV
jgi:hypothetical protein